MQLLGIWDLELGIWDFNRCQFSAPFPASRGEEGRAMAKTTRNLAMAAVAAAVLGTPNLCAAADELAVNAAAPASHVRSGNPQLVALIQKATDRSATFRHIIETI